MSRRTWVYTEGGRPLPEPVEVSEDWKNVTPRTGDGLKFEFDNMRAPDGTDISSYTKHKDYLRATGYALESDYKESHHKLAEQRAAKLQGKTQQDRKARREAIGRAFYELEKKARSSKR